ncbi:MAG: OmpA family protein [Acetobacteraceae bacterium]
MRGGARTGNFNISSDYNHSFLLGVRYAFDTAPPPAPAAEPALPPAVTPARSYLVFFDWDRADLTDRARQIVAEAAQASTRVQTTRIEVQGNADRSGTPAYNQSLSLRRAQVVAAELVRHGVPRTEIAIEAFGDTRPLVPTAAGVREPQNRRVEIILH